MILSHMASSCFNMSPYQTLWIHFTLKILSKRYLTQKTKSFQEQSHGIWFEMDPYYGSNPCWVMRTYISSYHLHVCIRPSCLHQLVCNACSAQIYLQCGAVQLSEALALYTIASVSDPAALAQDGRTFRFFPHKASFFCRGRWSFMHSVQGAN